MLKVGIFVDIANQVNALDSHKRGNRINYRKYLEHFTKDDKIIWKSNAYGIYLSDTGLSFIQVLTNLGYQPSFFKTDTPDEYPNRCLEIALDIVDAYPKLDIVVIGSNSRDFIPLIRWLRDRSVRVWVVTPFLCHQEADVNVDLLNSEVVEPIHVIKG